MSKKVLITESELVKIINKIIHEMSSEKMSLSKSEIMDYQRGLKEAGFGDLLGKTGEEGDGVDGIFGIKTQNALNKFQQKNNIKDEKGFFGKKTIELLTPLISKKSNFTKKSDQINKKSDQINKKSNSYLYFDGKMLKLIINGSVRRQWNAWSGRTKWNAQTPYQRKLADTLSKIEFMKIKDAGPIPEGQYYISQIQARTNGNSLTFCGNKDWVQLAKLYTDEYNKIGDNHNFNAGTAQDMIAWGNYRLPITPKPGTNTFSRGSFYLHGGGIAGSIGCIDLVDKIDEFVSEYKNYLSSSGKKILDLYVDYSGKVKLPTQPLIMRSPQNVGEPESERLPQITNKVPGLNFG